MTGPILCAVDFSDDSRAALLWACSQAELTDAALVVLHVVHDPASSPGFYRQVDEDWLRPMTGVAEEMMEEFLADVRASAPGRAKLGTAQGRLVSGLPAGRVIEVAESVGASMIVVGSRGRTGLPQILLGSVAERIAQTAAVPVVVVKAPAEEPS